MGKLNFTKLRPDALRSHKLATTKPKRAKVIPFATPHNTFDAVPPELKAATCWVVWREEVRNGKPTKIPKDVNTGNNASADDPSTWTTFDAAVAEYKAYSAQLNGIGRMFDGSDHVMGIDFDDCLDERGYTIPGHAAAQWLYRLNSYSEVSPSGRGVKVWVHATHDLGGKTGRRDSKQGVEIYSKQRFFTVTGAQLKKYSGKVEQRQDVVDALYKSIFSTKLLDTPPVGIGTGLSDDETIKRAGAAKNGEKFKALWDGNWEETHGSQSEADSALCHMLWFWSGGNRETVRRMFGQSALGQRDKWQDRSDYQNSTLDAACKGDTYKGAQANTTVTIGLEMHTIGELLARPATITDWVWQDRLAPGSVNFAGGKKYAGKSTVARNLTIAVSRGEPFLGKPTKKGSVLYLALEEPEQHVIEDFRALGATAADDIRIVYMGDILNTAVTIREFKPALVIVDTMARLTKVKSSDNGYEGYYNALGPFIELANENKTCFLFLHHAAKAEKELIDSFIGSTAIVAVASALILVRKKEGRYTIETEQRMGENLSETTLIFDPETKHLKLGGTCKEIDLEKIELQILVAVGSEEVTEEEIFKRIEGRTLHKREAIRRLCSKGKLHRRGTGKRGEPYKYSFLVLVVPGSRQGNRERAMGNKPKHAPIQGQRSVPHKSPLGGTTKTRNSNCAKTGKGRSRKVPNFVSRSRNKVSRGGVR